MQKKKKMQTKSYRCVRPVWFTVKSQILKTWSCLVRLPSSTLLLLGRGLGGDQFGMSLGGEPGALQWGAVPVAMHWTPDACYQAALPAKGAS